MNTPAKTPASLQVAAILCFASAVYGLVTGSLGLELYAWSPSRGLAVLMALVHVYCGFGLWSGDNWARTLTLWLLGLAFFSSWLWLAQETMGDQRFSVFAGAVINLFVICFFLWHLSGPNAMAYTGNTADHGEEHDHAHA